MSIKTLIFSAFVASSSAVRLYSAHSDGNVSSLSFDGADGAYTLEVTARTAECKNNPAVLTLDKDRRVVYCYDRGGSADTIGSLTAFAISDTDGSLTPISRVEAPYGGVWAEILTAENGNRTYISSSYNPPAVGVFLLGENGTVVGSGPIQTLSPTIEVTGPIADRQDHAYVHEVIIDPTNKYVVTPDLGGDRIRVYSYAPDTIVPLTELEPLRTAAGVGPRHGFFRINDAGETYFFHDGELSQHIYSYKVTYGEAGLTWENVFSAPALGPNVTLPPNTAPASECLMTPDKRFLIVSNREKSFANSSLYQSGPSDTLSTWAINEDGTMAFVQAAPSGGYLPRQLSVNKAGDMIAVGHQVNQTVVIWKRDVESGKILTEDEGGKLGETVLSGQVVSTIWDE
ncbi:hypothetical protein N0V82_004062 [Gnomoniopsis sp. IMI 355080]|nr:hypothetical protein N0V82_004062 [Gnomoniopsis sp. IMI 355080]